MEDGLLRMDQGQLRAGQHHLPHAKRSTTTKPREAAGSGTAEETKQEVELEEKEKEEDVVVEHPALVRKRDIENNDASCWKKSVRLQSFARN